MGKTTTFAIRSIAEPERWLTYSGSWLPKRTREFKSVRGARIVANRFRERCILKMQRDMIQIVDSDGKIWAP